MKASTVLIEFDTPTNSNVLFQPLQRVIRGRFDARRIRSAGPLWDRWPEVIPGQRLQLNTTTGEAAIVEPLWNAEHSTIRNRIESRGMKLAPGSEELKADVPTWVYWIRQLVESGKAKLVSGELPTKVEGTPRTRFLSNETPEPIDRLTDAIREQTEVMTQLLQKLTK